MLNSKDFFWNMPPNKAKALMLAKRQLAELVYDAVNLEDIPYTLPEVQTLLEGITVGGHKISDQQVVLNQANAWRQIFTLVATGQFAVELEQLCALHGLAAKDDALEWGRFRSGGVTIAGTSYLPPPAEDLPHVFKAMCHEAAQFDDVYDRAIYYFLSMARSHFFYDVNKRMGRFVMNGFLLSQGYPAINLPAKRLLEFNQLMLAFYDSGNQQQMNAFMRSCLSEHIINIMKEHP